MTSNHYHTSRFTHDPRRQILWRAVVETVFQPHIGADAVVLDLGAGYGELINAVKARRRIAVDLWEGMPEHLADGVEGIISNVTELEGIDDDSVDHVFSSNCFEHLTQEDMLRCLSTLKKKMKPGATLDIIQPNFRYCYREYFDDYTHLSVYTHVGLSDLLTASGFKVQKCVPRFLPFTLKSRLPVHPFLIRLYLSSPIRPLAKQMWIHASL